MTSPQFLIVKIQAILGGRAEDSEMQRRSVAMEYYKLCRQAETQLEHCVALIKAGREYTALQVAESSNLMDSLNALMFPELNQWRDFCDAEKLPSPPPFDDYQIELINSIYSRGVSQNHPLYRDYRRAMRLRKYEDALPIIKTISKINAYDADVRSEYNRLRAKVTAKKLTALERALFEKNDEEISKIYKKLESESDLILDNPIWIEASVALEAKELENERKRCVEIIEELKRIDLDLDFAQASDLVTEFNVFRNKTDISADDIKFIESVSREIADRQDKIIATERSVRAKNAIKMELENPAKKESISEKISRLKHLRQEANGLLDDETEKRYIVVLSKLNRKKNFSFIFKTVCTLSSAAAVVVLAFILWQNAERAKTLSIADSKLAEIERLRDVDVAFKMLDEFEKKYPEFSSLNFSSRILSLKESLKVSQINLDRCSKVLSEIENINFVSAKSPVFDNALKSIERLYSDITQLSQIEQATFSEKLDNLSKRLRDAVENRKIANARNTRKWLDEFEKVAEEYENFARSKNEIDADAEKIAEKLRPLIEDVSATFKAHRLDVDKFNELSVRISDAKNKYATFGKLRDLLFQSRNLADYMSALAILEDSGTTPAEFARKLSRIAKKKNELEIGQLADFGTIQAIDNSEKAGDEVCVYIPKNKMLTSLYKYWRSGKYNVYTIGKLDERVIKWNGGEETIQEVKEVLPDGESITKTYRRNIIAGRSPNGELLEGGSEASESIFARAALECASEQSALSALTVIANTKVNAIFKARLEFIVFEKMRENPIATLFEYSPLAQERAKKIERYAKQFSDSSWIFESNSKEKLIASELYSNLTPDYYTDAIIHLNAIKIAKQNPLELVGVCDEFGKPSIFKDANGEIWGISNDSEKFGRLGKNFSDCANKFAPLSPILCERKSTKQIMSEASKMKD